ncbi:MAG TPA: hypothetical protein VLI41_02910 [Phenylobacterium sp.]|uniref:hypothetical protein n=1 Tax=Phenylobacterium sp. TaxID=1871053 RepID=UPI002D0FB8F1|nr:hypothetical protein [Phenylobacterium sp.]HSV02132.1 hypothetical protein [Phenylobacterium sp.]
MIRAGVLSLSLALAFAGAAEGRTHRLAGFHAPRAPKTHAAGRHRPGMAEIEPLGPSSFHPVKRWKGFSYLDHEKRPGKAD